MYLLVCKIVDKAVLLLFCVDHKKKMFRELFRCVKIVWELVQDKLSKYGMSTIMN